MTNGTRSPVIAVLGASGLLGEAICSFLSAHGHDVVPIARRFTPVQEAMWRDIAVRFSLVEADGSSLAEALAATKADVFVNCVGALQDTLGSSASDANRDFVARLTCAMKGLERPALLVHVSIPGHPDDDLTEFSRSKRAAEGVIAQAGQPFVILRPGFVLADAAFGGSALMRALAVWPIDLPDNLARRPFAVTDVRDIGRSVAFLAKEWVAGRRNWCATWDVMAEDASTVGSVVSSLRDRFAGPKRRITAPRWSLAIASRAGDLVSNLGWRPPVRTTALAEMTRGVLGDPGPWRQATGIEPRSGTAIIGSCAATVQERWFARLYLLKALVFASLALFWIVSGTIAIMVSFDAATRILTEHGFGQGLARSVTVASSLMDIAVGMLIATRRTCRFGLLAGISVSLFYMVSAAVVTPELWIEPLGALVKTAPAIVLMTVGLAVLDER